MEDKILNGPLPEVHIPDKSYGGSAIRFIKEGGCCTTAYSYRLTNEERHYLALRVAAALNATRNLSLYEIESLTL